MKQSAGILLYQFIDQQLQVLLVHPGGPFWVKKDAGAWTIPKGEPNEGEDLLVAARREFFEETGQPPTGDFIKLSSLKQKNGKIIHAWALMGTIYVGQLVSNHFEMEWPPKSGKMSSFPEIDRAEWFSVEAAFEKILPGQQGFIKELVEKLES